MGPFLLVGMLFVFLGHASDAYAGLLFTLLGNEAKADLTGSIASTVTNNSQTMALLQAHVVATSLKEDKRGGVDEDMHSNIVADSALLPTTSPLGASGGLDRENFSLDDKDLEIYVVRSGDTVESVAKLFEVSPDTIMSANDIQKGEKLKVGDVLLILPFSGVEHTVTKGETLQGIANKYKVDINEILLANDIDMNAKLTI